jgi:hypothetical protein
MKKSYQIKILAFFCCISILENIYSQNKLYVGPSFGYATGKINMEITPLNNPIYSMNTNHNMLIGGDIRYTLEHSVMGFNSGVKFNRKWDNKEEAYSYINIPFVLDFTFGKKVLILIGGGVYTNILLKHNKFVFEESTSRFLYGRIINIGFGVCINDNILQLKIENYSDISETGKFRRHALAGGFHVTPYKLHTNSFSISYLIKI